MRPANLGAGSIRMASQSKMRPDLVHNPGDRCLVPDGWCQGRPTVTSSLIRELRPPT